LIQKERLLSPSTAGYKTQQEIKAPSVWVKKWVDYSSKYGLGYMLSNSSTGVFFNDSTKILMDTNSAQFQYYERKAISSTEKQDVMVTHSLTDYPKDLAKKVTLLQHFRSYLENNTSSQQNVEVGANKDVEMADETTKQGGAFVYVKKWMRTKHAIMFRLSNKIV
jgi:polo-like kinase 1